ncbi:hypothetical protein NH340_JMT03652 [Sarcoptes scabiei]|nr:hypothetical protein NH340_JMT03652 [Sarcoptes scabiei]
MSKKECKESSSERDSTNDHEKIRMKIDETKEISSKSSNQNEVSLKTIETPKQLLSNGYQYIELIDEGTYGKIFSARKLKTGSMVAIKQIDRLNSRIKSWLDNKCLDQEMKIMLSINHNNLIGALDVFKFRTIAFIVMPLVDGGNVKSLLLQRMKPFEEMQARRMFYDMNNFEQNLPNDSAFCYSPCGTVEYTSPEVNWIRISYLREESKSINQRYDAKSADIYSLGVCLYEILHLFKAFIRPEEIFVLDIATKLNLIYPRQMQMKLTKNPQVILSTECSNLLWRLLRPDPTKRPRSDEILSDVWLTPILSIEQRKLEKLKAINTLIQEYLLLENQEYTEKMRADKFQSHSLNRSAENDKQIIKKQEKNNLE